MKTKLFTLCTLLLIAANAFAYDFKVDGIYYNITSSESPYTAEVTRGGSYSGDISIPASVTYRGTTYAVTSIGDSTFYSCTGLTSITIGNSVRSIGERTFSGCTGLTSITIGNSVRSIGERTFSGCTGLTSIFVEKGNPIYHSAGNCLIETAFKILMLGCSTSVIPVDGSVTSIGYRAFSGCTGLTSITIPDSVTSIGEYAFSVCTGLTSITIGNSVTSIGEYAFLGCDGLTSITIPNSVTSIEKNAFYNCDGLTSITIGNSVTSIGKGAFEYCDGLTSIFVEKGNPIYHSAGNCLIKTAFKTLMLGCSTSVIPVDGSVTSIGEYAFCNCTGLTSITIPDSVTSIGEDAFLGCDGLTSVTIGESVTSIGHCAFYGCDGLTSVTWNAINYTNQYSCDNIYTITEFVFGEKVQSIPTNLCSGMKKLTNIAWNAKHCEATQPFADSKNTVTSFTFGPEVEYIPAGLCKGMVNNIGLVRLNLPKLVEIGADAFNDGAPRLARLEMGVNTFKIGNNAFANCGKLTRVTCLARDVPEVDESSFYNYNGYLYVPCEALEDYEMDMTFGKFQKKQCVAADGTITGDNVTVVPGKNDAEFTWPNINSATSYTLQISKDGEVFCTLRFNEQGQLIGIAFAPAADGATPAPQQAQASTAGWTFTVTGLDEASHYTYLMEMKDATDNVLKAYSGQFATEGAAPLPTSLQQGTSIDLQIINGTIICPVAFTVYNLTGQDVTAQNGSLPAGVYIVRTATAAQKVRVE